MDECPICLEELSGAVTTVGCCKKQFHTGCILKCTQHRNECPMCRVKECIVYVPDPTPDTEVDTSTKIASSMIIITLGCVTVTIGILTLKSYMNM